MKNFSIQLDGNSITVNVSDKGSGEIFSDLKEECGRCDLVDCVCDLRGMPLDVMSCRMMRFDKRGITLSTQWNVSFWLMPALAWTLGLLHTPPG